MSGGISGGHINPAVSRHIMLHPDVSRPLIIIAFRCNAQVTISLATFRGFPWWKVPIYVLAQLLGGIVGAAVVYANYFHAINLFEGGSGVRTVPGTASLFGTYAVSRLQRAIRRV